MVHHARPKVNGPHSAERSPICATIEPDARCGELEGCEETFRAAAVADGGARICLMQLRKRSMWCLWWRSQGLKARLRLRIVRGGTLAKAPHPVVSARMASVS